MSEAFIDKSVVVRLIDERIVTKAPGVPLYHKGEHDPTGLAKWARLLTIDVRGIPASTGDNEPDHARVLVIVAVVVSSDPGAGGSSLAVESAAAEIAKALHLAHLTGGGHDIQLEQARIEDDGAPGDDRRIVGATVTVEGTVGRLSGSTLETHP